MTAEVTHPLRSDARDNRARILDAARTVFGEEGLGAPMREVARRAGSARRRCTGTSRPSGTC